MPRYELVDLLFFEKSRKCGPNLRIYIFPRSERFQLRSLLLGEGPWNNIFSDGGSQPNTNNSGWHEKGFRKLLDSFSMVFRWNWINPLTPEAESGNAF